MDMRRRDRAMRRREMRDMARRDRESRDMARGRGRSGVRGRDYGMGDYAYNNRELSPRHGDRTYSEHDSAMDMYDYEPVGQHDMGYYPFEVYGGIDMTGMDYARRRNSRGRFMRDRNMDGHYYHEPMYMDYADGSKLPQDELEDWHEELLEEIPHEYRHLYKKENIEQVAKQMQIEFNKFSPLELTVTATMLASDFKEVFSPSDIQRYVSMAKAWLCDKDSALKYGERLATYYDDIING